MTVRKMFMLMHSYDLVNPKTEAYHFMQSDLNDDINDTTPPEDKTACGMETIDRKAHWGEKNDLFDAGDKTTILAVLQRIHDEGKLVCPYCQEIIMRDVGELQ
jgi:hypothetical protein